MKKTSRVKSTILAQVRSLQEILRSIKPSAEERAVIKDKQYRKVSKILDKWETKLNNSRAVALRRRGSLARHRANEKGGEE